MTYGNVKMALAVAVWLILGPGRVGAAQTATKSNQTALPDLAFAELATAVQRLGLGSGPFVIGDTLTAAQTQEARNHLLSDPYPGTIKFTAADEVVVAAEESGMILAVYQRRENADAEAIKNMVGHLMARYGEPTTMAHEKLMYWAFGPEGRIDRDMYAQAKATGRLDVLATVKFNSTISVTPDLGRDNAAENGTIYYIITSDRLLAHYISETEAVR